MGEIVDNLHRADRQTIAVLRLGIHGGKNLLEDTHAAHVACAPFLMDHAALLIDFLAVEQELVGPVVENEQAGVLHTYAGGGNGRDVVYGLVGAGICVEILTEFHTDRLKPGYELVAGEVLGSVEAHMLQEVGETALVVVLKNRSDLLGDEEVCLTFGGLVVADVVVEAVGEHSVAHLRVGRQFVGLLGEAGEGHHGHRESGEQRFEVEFHWICKLNG